MIAKYKADAVALTPELLKDVQTAWTAYVSKNLAKSLVPATADDSSSASTVESYEEALSILNEINHRAQQDAKWLEAQKLAAEKFTMYLAAAQIGRAGLERAEQAVKAGETMTGRDEAEALIESNKDAVSLWLDAKVCCVLRSLS